MATAPDGYGAILAAKKKRQPKEILSPQLPRDAPPKATVEGTAWIPLPHGLFALVDAVDAERVGRRNWYSSKGYPMTTIKGKDVPMHAFVLRSTNSLIDHADGNPLNNTRANLRPATHQQNCANQKLRKDNTSGFKGVLWIPGRNLWHAQIHDHGKRYYLGAFTDLIAAACAYNFGAIEKFGRFARLNRMD